MDISSLKFSFLLSSSKSVIGTKFYLKWQAWFVFWEKYLSNFQVWKTIVPVFFFQVRMALPESGLCCSSNRPHRGFSSGLPSFRCVRSAVCAVFTRSIQELHFECYGLSLHFLNNFYIFYKYIFIYLFFLNGSILYTWMPCFSPPHDTAFISFFVNDYRVSHDTDVTAVYLTNTVLMNI